MKGLAVGASCLLFLSMTAAVYGWSYNRRSIWDEVELLNSLRSAEDTAGTGGGQNEDKSDHSNSSEEKTAEPVAMGLMDVFAGATTTEGEDRGGQESTLSSRSRMAKSEHLQKDEHGRVQMGVASEHCDDGKTNLTLDWDMSPINHTCFHPETRFPMDPEAQPTWDCVDLPESYRPDHFCMDEAIPYSEAIPTHGPHRPLWPKFGEYQFVPRERWLHNIEHGSVVFLYHPCAQPMEVKRLKSILKSCFQKHVITPSTLVTKERPLVLVAWGCRLQMAVVDDNLAKKFIREKALHGPEGTYTKEGQFELGLIDWANKTGNADYSRVLC